METLVILKLGVLVTGILFSLLTIREIHNVLSHPANPGANH